MFKELLTLKSKGNLFITFEQFQSGNPFLTSAIAGDFRAGMARAAAAALASTSASASVQVVALPFHNDCMTLSFTYLLGGQLARLLATLTIGVRIPLKAEGSK